ncbi:MAG: hypothetical protein ACLUGJ_11530 [Blautia wexlerae]
MITMRKKKISDAEGRQIPRSSACFPWQYLWKHGRQQEARRPCDP